MTSWVYLQKFVSWKSMKSLDFNSEVRTCGCFACRCFACGRACAIVPVCPAFAYLRLSAYLPAFVCASVFSACQRLPYLSSVCLACQCQRQPACVCACGWAQTGYIRLAECRRFGKFFFAVLRPQSHQCGIAGRAGLVLACLRILSGGERNGCS